jgi:hypothetical protein
MRSGRQRSQHGSFGPEGPDILDRLDTRGHWGRSTEMTNFNLFFRKQDVRLWRKVVSVEGWAPAVLDYRLAHKAKNSDQSRREIGICACEPDDRTSDFGFSRQKTTEKGPRSYDSLFTGTGHAVCAYDPEAFPLLYAFLHSIVWDCYMQHGPNIYWRSI